MEKIIWLESANRDLIDIYNYIIRDSKYYSLKTVNDIISLTDNLKVLPHIGRIVPEYPDKSRRELIYKSYRIIYEIQSNIIIIHRIYHSARLLSKELIF